MKINEAKNEKIGLDHKKEQKNSQNFGENKIERNYARKG